MENRTLHNIRYNYEHTVLPYAFYKYTEGMLRTLREKGLFASWLNHTKFENFDVTYPEEAFSVKEYPQEDGSTLMLLTMPKPESIPLCARIYLYQSADSDRKGYYTVEYDNLSGEKWFLCSWTNDNTHLNYGKISPLPDTSDPGYEDALSAEVNEVLSLAKK